MHTDLSPHLHSVDCNKLIEELKNCHKENTFAKFVGVCNDIDTKLVKCLKKERIARSAHNRAKALEQQQRIRERMSFQEES